LPAIKIKRIRIGGYLVIMLRQFIALFSAIHSDFHISRDLVALHAALSQHAHRQEYIVNLQLKAAPEGLLFAK